MSKTRTPSEKKRLSLERDRRNTFGESPHASRKNIPKRKAMQHQQERMVANQALTSAAGAVVPEAYDLVDSEIKSKTKLKRLGGFKKKPDTALGVVIERKISRRKLKIENA